MASFLDAVSWVLGISLVSNAVMMVADTMILQKQMQIVGMNLCSALRAGEVEWYETHSPADGIEPLVGRIHRLKDLQDRGEFNETCHFAVAEGDASCLRREEFFGIRYSRDIVLPDGRKQSEPIPREKVIRPTLGMDLFERYWNFGRNYSVEVSSHRTGTLLRFRVATPIDAALSRLFAYWNSFLFTHADLEWPPVTDLGGCPDSERLVIDRVRRGGSDRIENPAWVFATKVKAADRDRHTSGAD